MSMRMRKKRNFESRIEACKDLLLARGAGGILNMKEAAENYRALVDFPAVFGNDFPVELEIGCGFYLRSCRKKSEYQLSCPRKDEQRHFDAHGGSEKARNRKYPLSQYPRRMSALLCSGKFPPKNLSEFFHAVAETRLCDAETHTSEFFGDL